MKKLFISMISNLVLLIIPLLGKPELILHFRTLTLAAGSIIMWLTQPVFSLSETKNEKNTDRFSILLILLMSAVSVITPVVDWAYFKIESGEITPMYIAGVIVMLSGLLIRAYSVQKLGSMFTPTVQIQSSHKLIKEGPYSVVRHPSYLGAWIAFIGGALVFDSWIGAAAVVISMGIAYYVRIKIEEKELKSYFGKAYEAYIESTYAIIPFIW
jgi:protein-S-isoprenylcysteine O-methyltransferase Ste14